MRRAAFLVALLALTGCGGGGDAEGILTHAATSLQKVRSATLDLRLVVTPLSGLKGRVGFALHGPFELRANALPIANIVYTQYAGARQGAARFVSNGTTAYALSNGRRVDLPASALQQLRGSVAGLGGNGAALRFETWLKDPHVSDGGKVGGAETDHVSGDLDPVNAANGLLGLLRGLGRAVPTVPASSADQLRKAVKSSNIDVWVGKQDKLLRKLALKAQIGFDVPASLKRALGNAVGATVEFEFALANPNKATHS